MLKLISGTKFYTFLGILVIMSGLILAACSEDDTDRNNEAIKKVLEHQFNGPDENFVDLVMNPKYKTVVNNKEENIELDHYVEEIYGPYFIDTYIPSFISSSGTIYPLLAYHSGNKLNIKDIKIEQNETMPNRYTFIVTVGYQKNDEKENTANVSGEVIFSTKEDKIGKFQYKDEEGFANKMMKDIND